MLQKHQLNLSYVLHIVVMRPELAALHVRRIEDHIAQYTIQQLQLQLLAERGEILLSYHSCHVAVQASQQQQQQQLQRRGGGTALLW